MTLTQRMRANCDLVPPCSCLADVGTDHGYVPITLVTEGKVRSAIAMDVNRGPLQRAEENVKGHGLEDKISLRLSDGLTALGEGEADVVLIAGMGGPLTIRILRMGEKILESGVKALVLQPQSEVPDVREYLAKTGWKILRENMVLEDGKFYPMMEAERGQEELNELQLAYGPRLLEQKNETLLAYLLHEEQALLKVTENLEKAEGRRKEERLAQVRMQLEESREAQQMVTAG